MNPLANLPGMFEFYGACEGVSWLRRELMLFPQLTVRELWAKMLKQPSGIAWGAWVAKKIDMECHNGTYSGMPKVNSGPGVEQLDVVEVERRVLRNLEDYNYFLRRHEALVGGMRSWRGA